MPNTIENPTSIPKSDVRKMKNFIEEIKSFFIGDDVFISYARGDTTGYALTLANRLTKRKFICYLDQYGTGINDRLDERVKKKLRRSRVLVIIGSHLATKSSSVREEVDLFKLTQRAIIPIDIDGAFNGTDLYKVIRGLPLAIEQHLSFSTGQSTEITSGEKREPPVTNSQIEFLTDTESNLLSDKPSRRVIDGVVLALGNLKKPDPSRRIVRRIASTIRYTKRTQLQRGMLWFGSIFLLVSVMFAFLSLYTAQLARAEAKRAGNEAEQARVREQESNDKASLAQGNESFANFRQAVAEINMAVAETKTRNAEAREKTANEKERRATTNARNQERVAHSLNQVAEASQLVGERPADALVVSAAAFQHAPDVVATRSGLLRNLQRYPHLKSVVTSHPSGIRNVASALNGRVLVSINYAAVRAPVTIRFYDRVQNRFFDPIRPANALELKFVSCLRNGRFCAASDASNIFAWRLFVRGGELIIEPLEKPFKSPEATILSKGLFSLFGDSSLVAYDGYKRVFKIWDLAKPDAPPKPLDWSGEAPSAVVVSPDNRTLAVASKTGVSFVSLDATKGTPNTVAFPEGTFPEGTSTHSDDVESIAFSAGGDFVAVGNSQGTTVLIDAMTNAVVGKPLLGAGTEVTFVQIEDATPSRFRSVYSQSTLLVTSGYGPVSVWKISVSHRWREYPGVGVQLFKDESQDYGPGAGSVSTLGGDSHAIVIGGTDGSLSVWDLQATVPLDSVNDVGVHTDDDGEIINPVHLAFDKTGTILLVSNRRNDRDIFEFSKSRLKPLDSPDTDKRVGAANFSPWVYAGGRQTIVLIEPMKPQDKPQKLPVEEMSIEFAVMSSNSKKIAVITPISSGDNKKSTEQSRDVVVVVDITGKERSSNVKPLIDEEDATCVAFNSNGKLVAVGYTSGQIVVWDVATSKKIQELRSNLTVSPLHDRFPEVETLAFSADGKMIASSSVLSPVSLWDTKTGTLIGSLETLNGEIPADAYENALVFSPDGKKLLTNSKRGIKVWDVDSASWAKRAREISLWDERLTKR